jgi:hypothetical protein
MVLFPTINNRNRNLSSVEANLYGVDLNGNFLRSYLSNNKIVYLNELMECGREVELNEKWKPHGGVLGNGGMML